MPHTASARDDRLQAFDLGGSGPTALLLHGFSGTPFELCFLGRLHGARPHGARLGRPVARFLGARPVRMLRLERSAPALTLGVERQRAAEEIRTFFRGLR